MAEKTIVRGVSVRGGGELGEKAKRRVEPQRVDSTGKIGGKDRIRW